MGACLAVSLQWLMGSAAGELRALDVTAPQALHWHLSIVQKTLDGFLASLMHVACALATCAAVLRAVSALHRT